PAPGRVAREGAPGDRPRAPREAGALARRMARRAGTGAGGGEEGRGAARELIGGEEEGGDGDDERNDGAPGGPGAHRGGGELDALGARAPGEGPSRARARRGGALR